MALKYGFKVYLIDPSYTSKIGEMLRKELRLYRYSASAYMLALKNTTTQCLQDSKKVTFTTE